MVYSESAPLYETSKGNVSTQPFLMILNDVKVKGILQTEVKRRSIIRRILVNKNLHKISVGTPFLLLWGALMYELWDEPSFVTFILFYLLLGNVVLKWTLFELVDHLHIRFLQE